MRTLFVTTLLAAIPLVAADPDFNGRWDITATQPHHAWWLELSGAGTANASGKFVSAFSGDMNPVANIAVANGELSFSFQAPPNSRTAAPVFCARLVNGKLEGTTQTPGSSDPPVKWTGLRAPAIAEKDDGSWQEAKPVELFNGKDLRGWQPSGPESKWSVQAGTLRNTPPAVDLVSEQKFWNFKLHVEFRITERSNSGIGLRGRYEIQILDDFGRPPGTHGASALYSRIAPRVNASKPAGEWQTYDIRLVGRTLTVVHNGTTVLDRVEVEGLTAIAQNSDEALPGPFIIQGDHGYVEFKSFLVTPLVKK